MLRPERGPTEVSSLRSENMIFPKNLTIKGLWLSHWLKNEDKSNIEEVYQDLAKKMLDEKLDQPIDSVYGLEELEEAVKRSMQEGRNGKVLLKFKS